MWLYLPYDNKACNHGREPDGVPGEQSGRDRCQRCWQSTAINMLVGEQLPTEGSIWKAQGLRLACVAQHALHHLEKHMQRTPTDYIMWRFAGNDDRESLEFKTDELSVDEATARAAKWCIDSVSGNVRRRTDPKETPRRLNKTKLVLWCQMLSATFEYEVKWQFKALDQNT